MNTETIEIYTDGGCRPNPGTGVAGFVAIDKDDKILHEFTHVVPRTTNNSMELLAMIAALKWVKRNVPNHLVYITTDSQYVQNGLKTWIWGWKKNNWISSTKKPVKNKELWIQLDALNTKNITIQWVRSHNGNKWNEYIDNLCSQALTKSTENEPADIIPDYNIVDEPTIELLEESPF